MLRSLQKKPLHTRAHVAFMVAFLVVTVVAALWVMTLPTKFANIREANEQVAAVRDAAQDAEDKRTEQEAAAILSGFVASSTEVYKDLGAQLEDLGGKTSESGEETATSSEALSQEVATTSASSTIIIRELP